MICRTQELQSLNWLYDGGIVINFPFTNRSTHFPLTIFNDRGVLIQIIDANSESPDTDEFNATSTLMTTTLALDMLNVNNIQCGTRAVRSSPVDLTMLNIEGK